MRFRARLSLALVLVAPGLAGAVDIVRCGQVIQPGETAVLQVDLDCSVLPGSCVGDPSIPCTGVPLDPVCPVTIPSSPDPDFTRTCSHGMIALPSGATLDLNGHALVGDPIGLPYSPVNCTSGSCTVRGPGEIRGSSRPAIFLYRARLTIQDVSIHDNVAGIVASDRGSVRATNLSIADNLHGTELTRLIGENVSVTDNGHTGVSALTVRARGLTVTGNGFGSDPPIGGAGIWAKTVVVRDGTITGNNGNGQGYDIMAVRRPRLRDVTCGTSAMFLPGTTIPVPTWGVCAND
jgi:hypothetical protein